MEIINDMVKNSENLLEFFKKYKILKKTNSDVEAYIISKTSFLEERYSNIHINQRLVHIYNNYYEFYVCEFCGELVHKYVSVDLKNDVYYNTICKNKKCIILKRKAANLKKYGVENAAQSNTIKDKMKATNLKKYGVENVSQSEVIKKRKISTCFINFGVDHPMQSKVVQEKSEDTCMSEYGKKYTFQTDNFKMKARQTWEENYGVKNPSQSEKIKNLAQQTYAKNFLVNSSIFVDLKKRRYEMLNYIGSIFTLKCPKCNEIFNIHHKLLYSRLYNHCVELCVNCNPLDSHISGQEVKLNEFINSLGVETEQSNRTILGNREIDIYIPSMKIGFEFNGIYWHSDKYKSKDYHQEKKFLAAKNNINLIHIWEDDWNFKNEIVKSRIRAVLGISKRIYGRKTEIREVSSVVSREFLNINHIQGHINSKHRIGLFYESNLVALMTFGKRNDRTEMLRYCNLLNYTVIGGFSKLLKYYIQTYSPKEIFSYADLDWSNPNKNVYLTTGFKFCGNTVPGYSWVKSGIRYGRQQFQKHKLVNEGFDPSKTETEIMHDRGYNKIYNSGNGKYLYKK